MAGLPGRPRQRQAAPGNLDHRSVQCTSQDQCRAAGYQPHFTQLFNNALYALRQKEQFSAEAYQLVLEVSTFAPASGGWGIKIQDNGTGIPDAIKDKIMQPFFTTKPAGQGTGLGLSLSYDIIKAYGGQIVIDSIAGVGTNVMLEFPAP